MRKKKLTGLPKGFDPATGETPSPIKEPRGARGRKIRVRRPLASRPPEAKIARFVEASKPFRWPKGKSGNPAGRRPNGPNYAEFIANARKLSPRALDRLREALELPWAKATSRTILTACALVLERSYGRAVAVNVDVTPDRTAPVIPLDTDYWLKMTDALRESGALEKPIDADAKVVVEDAEVVEVETEETKLIEPPRP